MRIKGKVALVTGAAQGIGREICLRFAAEGAKVCASDLDKDGLETIAAEINGGGGEAIGIKADIGREAEVEFLLAEVLRTYGSIDILVSFHPEMALFHNFYVNHRNHLCGVPMYASS